MLQPIFLIPGIDKSQSEYAGKNPFSFASAASNAEAIGRGRYVDGQWIRFTANLPEKIGGYLTLIASGTMLDTPRAQINWRDNDGNPRTAIGTDTHLYTWDGTTLSDITPFRTLSTGTLSAPFTTTVNSTTVAVTDSSQVLQNGDPVFLSAADAVGGIQPDGWFIVSGRSSGGYDILVPSAPTSSTSGGGSTAFSYPRINLSGPFTTTLDSAVVTVAQTGHGAATGDYVTFTGASAVGGLTLSGQYKVTVTSDNSYTVTAAAEATSGATGGGTVSTTFNVTMQQSSLTSTVTYGEGVYGTGPFGGSIIATQLLASGWTLSAYGSLLVSCPVAGTVYFWDPSQGGRSYPVLNAPTDVNAMFVTPERFIFALGTSSSDMQIAWCDQSDPTVWTSEATNTANTGRTLVGGAAFVGGIAVRDGVSLCGTDKGIFQATYSGDNYVYDTPLAGDNCGLIGAHAMCAIGEVAYWMGDSDFWSWNGTVSPLPSDDVRDYVFRNLNVQYKYKCFAATRRARKEIWFFYVSGSSTEVDNYVIFHTDQSCWSVGSLAALAAFSCATDANLFPNPMACDTVGNLYQLEAGTDAAGAAIDAWVTTSAVDLTNGNTNVDFFGFLADFQRQSGDLGLTVLTKYYPQDAATASGPYTIKDDDSLPRIDLRADGKMIAFKLESNVIGGDFRLGLPRVDIQPSGARN